MTDFVSMMDEYYALRLARNLVKLEVPVALAARVHEIKDLHIREAAQCLGIPRNLLLEAILKSQKEWMEKLRRSLPSL